MNCSRSLALASALALAIVTPTAAFALGGMLHPGFGGGISVPAGDLKDALKNGVHGTAFLGIGNGGPLGARIAIDYQHFNAKDIPVVSGGPASTEPGGTGSILAGLANISYGIKLGMLRPYLTAGLGAFDLGSDPSTGSSSSKTHFGINGGAGLGFKLGPVNAFVEGRYDNLFTDKGLDANASSAKDFAAQVIPITFGVSL
jgi:hypothetical protein